MDKLSQAMDQAASLREWALTRDNGQGEENALPEAGSANASVETLVVIGLPDQGCNPEMLVRQRLQRWADSGYHWAQKAGNWQVIAWKADNAVVPQSRRWALWIGTDLDSFDQCYRGLQTLDRKGVPRCILALHEPGMSSKGLLTNLEGLARTYFGIELVNLALP